MYHRILVATDFSPTANAALKRGIWVARRADCPLSLVHVLSDVATLRDRISYDSLQGFSTAELEKLERGLWDDSNRRLKKIADQFGEKGVNIQCRTLAGIPFVEVLRAVDKKGYDLVVTGRRGRSRIKHLLLGSTAKRLVHQCPTAVWVVKRWAGTLPKSVLVGVDFSDASVQALRHAAWLAQQTGATLNVLHVIDASDIPADLYEKRVQGSRQTSTRQYIRQAAKTHFDSFVARNLPSDLPAVRHLAWGNPWQEIVRVAERLSADPVVLGTVGRSGIKGILLGSTAERVLEHFDGSILAVKP